MSSSTTMSILRWRCSKPELDIWLLRGARFRLAPRSRLLCGRWPAFGWALRWQSRAQSLRKRGLPPKSRTLAQNSVPRPCCSPLPAIDALSDPPVYLRITTLDWRRWFECAGVGLRFTKTRPRWPRGDAPEVERDREGREGPPLRAGGAYMPSFGMCAVTSQRG